MGRRLPCCAGLSLADQGSHSHPRGDFAPYRALFSVSCAHPNKQNSSRQPALRTRTIRLALLRSCKRQLRRKERSPPNYAPGGFAAPVSFYLRLRFCLSTEMLLFLLI